LALCLLASLFLVILKLYLTSRPSPVYLVDFVCFTPPKFCRVPFSTFIEHVKMMDLVDERSIDFMAKVLTRSGQSQETYLPPSLHYIPPKSDHREAVGEVEMALFPVLQQLLDGTNTSPKDVDLLIVNCSGFCPNPSLSSMVINRFSMREDVKSFTLTGMGCSASAVAVDMARNILRTNRNSNAVILSTEILSTGWYTGKDQSMLMLNCLFRMGAAAVLVSNRKEAKRTAKYKLIHSVRTQRAFDDRAYLSAIREEDSDGLTGVTLRKDLLQVAGETLRSNIKILGRKLLPYTEILLYTISVIKKRYWDKSAEIYTPDFRRAVKHFCLPTSGKAVIGEIGKGLRLADGEMEPALMTLHRFGNQSSSSLWYELSYLEAKGRIMEGDRVWQLGMGTGPKCTSLVWESLRPILASAHKGPWADCIHRYPV
ncbi:hypothetical protein M569_13036, partial [Genlisea aurea]